MRSSIARRFPIRGSRSRLQYGIYNMFFRRGEVTGRDLDDAIAAPSAPPTFVPQPPIMPLKREWREAILEGIESAEPEESAKVA